MVILSLLIVTSQADARGRRNRPAPTAEDEVKACLSNTTGMGILTRKALNQASDPIADRMDTIDWAKYCNCFGPKFLEMKKEKKGDLEFFNPLYVTCAKQSATGKPHASAIQPKMDGDARFKSMIDHCIQSPSGYLTNVEVFLSTMKSPRAGQTGKLNVPQYCRCYFGHMRAHLGDSLALAYLGSAKPSGDLDFIKIGMATDKSYDACTIEQLPIK